MRFSLNLRQRFSLTVLTAITLASGIMMTTIYVTVANYVTAYTTEYWQEYTKTFANNAKFSVTIASSASAIETANNFSKEAAILRAAIVTKSGNTLAVAGEWRGCPKQSALPPIQEQYQTAFVLDTAQHWCFFAPIHYVHRDSTLFDAENGASPAQNWIGYIELVVSKQRLQTVIRRILGICIATVLLFEMVIFVSVRHFSDVLTRALLELSRVMRQTGQGQRGIRATFSGPQDMLVMKTQLNAMLDQLEGQEEQLEQQVATRTRELQTALDSALAASRYKSNIMSILSHEMKSPLHGFLGYSQLALEALTEQDDPNIKAYLKKGEACARQMETQINRILEYARLESGKSHQSLSMVEVLPLVMRCVEKIAPLAEQAGNQIVIDGDAIELNSDAEKLQHILSNLISNANKFTENGTITIHWEVSEEDLLIQVSDTGCGIPDADHEKIFAPFWQADMSLSRTQGGIGLGLAISKLFVELLSGTIRVTRLAQGTRFSVRIPISAS